MNTRFPDPATDVQYWLSAVAHWTHHAESAWRAGVAPSETVLSGLTLAEKALARAQRAARPTQGRKATRRRFR